MSVAVGKEAEKRASQPVGEWQTPKRLLCTQKQAVGHQATALLLSVSPLTCCLQNGGRLNTTFITLEGSTTNSRAARGLSVDNRGITAVERER